MVVRGEDADGADSSVEVTGLVRGLARASAVGVRVLPRPAEGSGGGGAWDGPGGGAGGGAGVDVFAGFRVARLAGAYQSASGAAPVVWVWRRGSVGGPVELLAAGTTVLPPQACTRALAAGALGRRLDAHPVWESLTVRADPLVGAGGEAGQPTSSSPGSAAAGAAGAGGGLALEHGLSALEGAFTVLVVAEPVAVSAVEECVRALDARAMADGRQRATRPDEEVAFGWWRERLRQLRLAQSEGAWLVRVVTGGPDAAGAAGVVSSGLELGELGYTLAPAGRTGDLTGALAGAVPHGYARDHERDWRLPDPAAGIVPSRVVAQLVRPPLTELPGIRLVAMPSFDVTPEHADDLDAEDFDGDARGGADGVRVRAGDVLDAHRRPAGGFTLGGDSLNRHVFVAGATGSGKSQTVRTLLENATGAGVPWLVIEPAKAEYRAMAARLADTAGAGGGVLVVRPGDAGAVAAGLDPLRPVPGFSLQVHLELVRALFLAAFDAQEPFPQVLALALTRCFEELGWDVATGQPLVPGVWPRYPTLTDLQQTAEQVVAEVGYGPEISQNVTGFIRVRLASLRMGTTGRFLEGGHQISIDQLLTRNVVLEIEDVGDDHAKAFLIGMVLIALVEHMRVRAHPHPEQQNTGLRHLTVFEEAHRLLRAPEPGAGQSASGHAVRMIAGLLAEIRAYGEGLVVAEQIPSHLITDVVKNTAIKILHRLPAADDRDTVGATMNLTEQQSRFVVTLPPGEAAAFSDGMDNPVLIRIPNAADREHGRPPTRGPEDITEPASGRCRADYDLHHTPESTISSARRLLRTSPSLTLWAELTTIALLTGNQMPHPSPRLRAHMEQADPACVDAALALAVDTAVANRSRHLWTRVPAAELAAYAAGTLREMRHNPTTPPGASWSWVVDGYRWQVVAGELSRNVGRADQPHPLTADLEEFIGERISGDGVEEQVRYARQRCDAESAMVNIGGVLLGDADPTSLEGAVGCALGQRSWEPALSEAVSWWLEPSTWIVSALTDSAHFPPDDRTFPDRTSHDTDRGW